MGLQQGHHAHLVALKPQLACLVAPFWVQNSDIRDTAERGWIHEATHQLPRACSSAGAERRALAACSDDARDEVEQDVEEGGRDVEQEAEENDGDNQGEEEDD